MIDRMGKGHEPLRIRDGGTEADNAAGARTNLAVAGLADSNSWTGANLFSGVVTFAAAVLAPGMTSESDLVLIGTDFVKLRSGSGYYAALDMTGLSTDRSFSFPDTAGTLLVDAPSDGKYYVRKDGAWVEIIP